MCADLVAGVFLTFTLRDQQSGGMEEFRMVFSDYGVGIFGNHYLLFDHLWIGVFYDFSKWIENFDHLGSGVFCLRDHTNSFFS